MEAQVAARAPQGKMGTGIGTQSITSKVMELGHIIPLGAVFRSGDHDILPTVAHAIDGRAGIAPSVGEAYIGNRLPELHLHIVRLRTRSTLPLRMGEGRRVPVNDVAYGISWLCAVSAELVGGGKEFGADIRIVADAVYLAPRFAHSSTRIFGRRGGEVYVGPKGIMVGEEVSVSILARISLHMVKGHIFSSRRYSQHHLWLCYAYRAAEQSSTHPSWTHPDWRPARGSRPGNPLPSSHRHSRRCAC